MKKRLLILVGAGLLVLCGTRESWAQKGGVWDLGTYPGGTWADPRGINNAGVIVGSGDVPGGVTRAIGVSLRGPGALDWFDLGTLGGDDAFPGTMCMGVSDTGLIVGHSFLPDNTAVHAFAWTHRSDMVDIGTLRPEHSDSYAYNVNKAGTLIVGWSGNGWWPENSRPVVWTSSRASRHEHDDDDAPGRAWTIHELDTTGFRDATNWTAIAVNDRGDIVGYAWDANYMGPATRWCAKDTKSVQSLEDLGFPDGDWSMAAKVNDAGIVAGGYGDAEGLWERVVALRLRQPERERDR